VRGPQDPDQPHVVIYYEDREGDSRCLTCGRLACHDCRRVHAWAYGVCEPCHDAWPNPFPHLATEED